MGVFEVMWASGAGMFYSFLKGNAVKRCGNRFSFASIRCSCSILAVENSKTCASPPHRQVGCQGQVVLLVFLGRMPTAPPARGLEP